MNIPYKWIYLFIPVWNLNLESRNNRNNFIVSFNSTYSCTSVASNDLDGLVFVVIKLTIESFSFELGTL